ncbi:hypothetical protein GCM10029992_45470 [Glycomyces albus]
MIPAAMILIATLVAVGYFVYANLASVLEPERFAAIEVGDDRVATERLLPPEEMLDAPRSLRPEPPGAECYYFEESVSFFRRANVFRICMDDDQVVSTDTIPPGY